LQPGTDLTNALLRKLQAQLGLSESETKAFVSALSGPRSIRDGHDLASPGRASGFLTVLLQGLACRYKDLPDGRRQIISFQFPGDIVDVHSFVMGRLDHAIGALSACQVAIMAHDTLAGLIDRHPQIGAALWRESLIDAAISREWIVNLGQRGAYERMAHLLCEAAFRQRTVQIVEGDRCAFPLTQSEISDALGLSVVHVNRVLQRLRKEGLITLRAGHLTIHDPNGLMAAGGFEPSYLQPSVPTPPAAGALAVGAAAPSPVAAPKYR
jgi:CRP-like cAMP-binding protein